MACSYAEPPICVPQPNTALMAIQPVKGCSELVHCYLHDDIMQTRAVQADKYPRDGIYFKLFSPEVLMDDTSGYYDYHVGIPSVQMEGVAVGRACLPAMLCSFFCNLGFPLELSHDMKAQHNMLCLLVD